MIPMTAFTYTGWAGMLHTRPMAVTVSLSVTSDRLEVTFAYDAKVDTAVHGSARSLVIVTISGTTQGRRIIHTQHIGGGCVLF